jgi:ATP-dependent Clp protease ATP-binding subunit ClpA
MVNLRLVLELALREALQLGHNYIGTEHILLGVLAEEDGVGARTLTGLGITRERVREWLVPMLEQLADQKRQAGLAGGLVCSFGCYITPETADKSPSWCRLAGGAGGRRAAAGGGIG